ncbi:YeeE/YedE family protein [Paenibacillus tritici]|uniref:YeeE/YedE thiosulfate transporter family protein n=1 Tax=Paenibacillus tritici TaxID=1873425 RepID=UPI001BADC97D|nr:YeeE/YedE thiosulfate transporter family protein [Paenibacillus tritici]QUL53506.1 YeeE/YedE family protein [Paenibacillus tritici]
MNAFWLKISSNRFYKQLLKEPLTYVTGAVLLAVLAIAHLAVFSKGWGVTSAFADWGAWMYQLVGGNVDNWAYFSSEKAQKTLSAGFLNDGGSIRNLGIILGALLATLFASEFKLKKLRSLKQVFAAVLGGLLMGYGARLANGCNIGALFTSISSLSLSGWIFWLFLLAGAFIGSKLLAKFFM